jgi:hypothetical protein
VKCGARVALGIVGGYVLGRTKKMKLAMMLAGRAAGEGAGGPGELLARGAKLLSSSPELAQLTDQVRGRLIEAGKGAAMGMAAHQVESLADRVGKGVESRGDLGTPRRARPEPEPEPDDVAADENGEVKPPPRGPNRRAAKAAPARAGGGGGGAATATVKRSATSTSGGPGRAVKKTAAAGKGARPARARPGNSNG